VHHQPSGGRAGEGRPARTARRSGRRPGQPARAHAGGRHGPQPSRADPVGVLREDVRRVERAGPAPLRHPAPPLHRGPRGRERHLDHRAPGSAHRPHMEEELMTAQTAAPAAAAPAAGALSHKQIMTILSGLLLGMFLAALDQTIVSTAIRTIGDDLNGLSVQAWVTTAFLITSTISTPLFGKLSDIYGRKPFFML